MFGIYLANVNRCWVVVLVRVQARRLNLGWVLQFYFIKCVDFMQLYVLVLK